MINKTIGDILDETAIEFAENDALIYVNKDIRLNYKQFKE